VKRRLDVDLASQVVPAIGERVRLRITHGNLFAAA
jgi:sulfate transport system ATP-binding protein